MLKSSNPALSTSVFMNAKQDITSEKMTIQGTVNKCFLSLFLVFAAASYTWGLFFQTGNPSSVTGWMIAGGLIGFILSLVTIFKKHLSPYTTPAYALAEGFFLGGISALFESSYPGIVFQAIGLTFGTLFCLLAAYKSRLIKVTENFKLGIAAATGGIALFYFVSFILGIFGIQIPIIHGSGFFGIGFSLFVVTIAALNLVMDFDFIENGAEMGAPKYMEWYGAFGLLVTLIWLYLEILRLLAKLQQRSR